MTTPLLEGIRLCQKYVHFNPYELMVFDRHVGKQKRSKMIRQLIKEFNRKYEEGDEYKLGEKIVTEKIDEGVLIAWQIILDMSEKLRRDMLNFLKNIN